MSDFCLLCSFLFPLILHLDEMKIIWRLTKNVMLEIMDNFIFIQLELIANDQKLSVDSNRELHEYIPSFTATPTYSLLSYNWFDTNIRISCLARSQPPWSAYKLAQSARLY